MTRTSTQRSARLAWGVWGLIMAGTLITVLSGITMGGLGFLIAFAIIPTVGALLAHRRPDNSIGWILLTAGPIFALGGPLAAYGRSAVTGSDLAFWMSNLLWAPLIGMLFIPLLLLFPTGRLPSRRWRWVMWTPVFFVVLAVVGNGFSDWPGNPYYIEGADSILTVVRDLGGLALGVGIVASVVSVVVRFRRAGNVERQQMKWFLAAAVFLPFAVVLGELNNQALQAVAPPLGMGFLAASIGIAVLRYRLYEIDRIISRTLTYALVTAVLAGVYVGGVFVVQSVLPGEEPNDLGIAASTLAAAALFSPLRRRVQVGVDRRFNRRRYNAERIVEDFTGRLQASVSLVDVASDLRVIVAQTVEPVSASVWLRGNQG
jgi:hypothetical protein